MNSAPEHTTDEDGEHPRDQSLNESVFTLFKQLICHLNLSDRLELSAQVLIMKDNVVYLSIRISDIDLTIGYRYDPKGPLYNNCRA